MTKIIKIISLLVILSGLSLSAQDAAAQARRLNAKRLAKLENNNAQTASSENGDQSQVAPDSNTANKPAPKLNQPVPPRLQVFVLDQFLGRLDLSLEQKTKLRDVRTKHFRQASSLLALERAQTKVYDDVLYSDEFDATEIEKRAADLAETRSQVIKAQARLFIEVRKILTPEQFAKMRQMIDDERMMRQQKNTAQ